MGRMPFWMGLYHHVSTQRNKAKANGIYANNIVDVTSSNADDIADYITSEEHINEVFGPNTNANAPASAENFRYSDLRNNPLFENCDEFGFERD